MKTQNQNFWDIGMHPITGWIANTFTAREASVKYQKQLLKEKRQKKIAI